MILFQNCLYETPLFFQIHDAKCLLILRNATVSRHGVNLDNTFRLESESKHVTENSQASIDGRAGYGFPSFLFEKSSVRRCELSHLQIPDDILNDLQRFFLEIWPCVADLAIFLKVNVRELSNREILRRLRWGLRQFLLQLRPRTHRNRAFDAGKHVLRESLVAEAPSEAGSVRPILRTYGVFLTCTF